jgi:hypothetical protein
MRPENVNYGGGVAESAISIPVLIVVILVCLILLAGSRRRALAAFLAACIMIPMDQVLVIGGLHFPMVRILIIFAMIRIIREKFSGKTELFSGGINWLDKWFLVLMIFTTLDGILLWQNSGYVVFALGSLFSAAGVYFAWRYFIRDEEDVRRVIRVLAVMMAAIAVIMIYEHFVGQNFYYKFLGGAEANVFGSHLDIRDGKIRARGVFAHPILAGSFGGFCFPLFVGLWWRGFKEDRKFAALGVLSALVPPFAANSSTALFGLLGGIIGLSFWAMRDHMRLIRWAIAGLLTSLHLVMKAPVWELINRVSLTDSSSSYHRYQLVDQCIRHFQDWFLIGTKNYGDWGWEMWDLSNSYVGTADTVGLIPLIAFIAILVVAYRYVGISRRSFESSNEKAKELFVWAFGASLFANTVAFMGIGYFDQTFIAWYCILAMVCAITLPARLGQSAPAPVPASVPSPVKIEGIRVASRVGPYLPSNSSRIPKYNPTRQKL